MASASVGRGLPYRGTAADPQSFSERLGELNELQRQASAHDSPRCRLSAPHCVDIG
jgi:hypothetical protein